MITFSNIDFYIFCCLFFGNGFIFGYAVHLYIISRRMKKQIAVEEDITAQVEREDRWFEEMHARAHEKLQGHAATALDAEPGSMPDWKSPTEGEQKPLAEYVRPDWDFISRRIAPGSASPYNDSMIPGYNVEPKPEFENPFPDTKKSTDGNTY